MVDSANETCLVGLSRSAVTERTLSVYMLEDDRVSICCELHSCIRGLLLLVSVVIVEFEVCSLCFEQPDMGNLCNQRCM